MRDSAAAPVDSRSDQDEPATRHGATQRLIALLRPCWTGHGLLLVALLLSLYCSYLWWHPYAMDDAYITFRYSRNLVDGHGPVYNPGERVEGYTTPVWMLLMAGVIALGGDPVTWSKVIGIISALGLVLSLHRSLLRAGALPGGAGLASITLACCPTLSAYATSGMETCLYALLLFLALERLARPDRTCRNIFLCSLLFIASALTHPEALALWGAAGIYILVSHGRQEFRKVFYFALPGLLAVIHFAWRYWYYGDLLPNTYYAWTGGGLAAIPRGLLFIERFLSYPSFCLWLGVAAYATIRTMRDRPLAVIVMSGTALFHLLYMVKMGGDHMAVFRTCLAFLAPLAYLCGLLLREDIELGNQARRRIVPATVGLVLVIGFTLLQTQPSFLFPFRKFHTYYEGNTKLGKYLAVSARPDTVVAVMAAGAIPYYSGLRTLDMLGLNDPHIARLPFPDIRKKGLNKWDFHYVLSLNPTLIIINRGYFQADDDRGRQATVDASSMIKQTVELELMELQQNNPDYDYDFIRFEDGSRFYVFERAGIEWRIKPGKGRP